MLIVDHYGLDAAWERRQRRWAKRIAVLDDLDHHHDCDILLDSTYGHGASDHAGPGCRVPAGSEYALLRPAFAAARAASAVVRERVG